MANKNNPTASGLSVNLLPDFYQTPANKKFLQATVDQLFQPGTVTKTSGFIGRENAKAANGSDVYVKAADTARQNYQLEPGLTVKDSLGNVTFFKDYIDYINQVGVFGGNTSNHARLNKQEFYSWDPHIDWDKFINFQNYYWLPFGPDTINVYGQQLKVASTYTVSLQSEGNTNEYLFTPDGLTLNPTLKLYRGQTYTFEIDSIGNPFSIKLSRSIGTIDRYKDGVSNYGVQSGTITFQIPVDAPSLLFYQSETDVNLGGTIEIFNIDQASAIDIEKDILGKKNYTLSDGTKLSNGMKLRFNGIVTPVSYSKGQFYVEGVGDAIRLVSESILEIVSPYTTAESIEFDSTPFDTDPFSDSTGFAKIKDYVVINRSSRDHNPWSRYNRWFHTDVITASSVYNKTTPSLDQAARAIRPIIEFEANLRLFNMGTTAISDVDLVDDYTTNVFSTIEGSIGYSIDGVSLSTGQRILFIADKDPLVYNNIFQVSFVNIQGKNQVHLELVDSPSVDQTVLILQGLKNQSQMYWYSSDKLTWIKAQQKTNTNQPPLFDIVDSSGISYGNASTYNGTTFTGTSIFSYKKGTGSNDATLGFPLSYQNVANIGDIVFNFTLVTDTFQYKIDSAVITKKLDSGFLIGHDFGGNVQYLNGWQVSTVKNIQAGIRIYKKSNQTTTFNIDIFDDVNNLADLTVHVYVNGVRLDSSNWKIVTDLKYKKVVLTNPIDLTDVLTIKTYATQPINSEGYYEIPINLQSNPLNEVMGDFTLGEVTDHVNSIIDNVTDFAGTFPGPSNLRDLGNITQYGTKFVQHSGPLSLGMYHITSESHNIIKAIETSRDDYGTFKRNFIAVASSLGVDGNPEHIVDLVLQKLNANKPTTNPYYFSDMVPYGASIKTDLVVVDYRIKTYPLTNVFSLDSLSNQAVLVYQTNSITKTKSQLVYGRDYTFNSQGFIVLDSALSLTTGDTITTVEYTSTDGCFVPATPTKLGMWPTYVPQIYTDTTLVTPRTMIQGHDGSQILAYGDYRDDLLLELETRIYNNIKVTYDADIFDVNDVVPSYNKPNDYTLAEFNQVLSPSFYKWLGLVGIDFTKHLTFDRSNSFTYNYSADLMADGTPALGYWRGVYRWLLGTDRPNICPWEILGFTIEPSWWVQVYGPAPYTNNNLVMWQDLANGVVRAPGKAVITLPKYVKPFLIKKIPVDESGNLVSPLLSGLTTGIYAQDTDNIFVFGDVGPVEAAWRRSSYYPFSVIIASMLLTPAKTFGLLLDRSRIIRNMAGQLVYKDTGLHIRSSDIKLPSIYTSTSRIQTAGIVNYIVDFILNYIFSNNINSYNAYANDLAKMNANLSYRVGAFTNKSQFNLLLESKTPLAVGSVFIPQEDFSIFLNSSSPVKKLTYSGVIITKVSNNGYEVKGYSTTYPYFNYYQWKQTSSEINVGGISENFVNWTPNQQYYVGTIVNFGGTYYRATATTSGATFDPTHFASLSSVPTIGGVTAKFRNSWDKRKILSAPYGTIFYSIQAVVDFLTGYGEYLKDQGFDFNNFNNNLNAVTNWETSAKEFMFWTLQNWSVSQDKWSDWVPQQSYTYGSVIRYNGEYYSANFNIKPESIFDPTEWTKLDGLSTIGNSVISLSPMANGVKFTTKLTVVDDITNNFNNYEFFKVDGTPIHATNLDSYREGNTITYSPRNNEGIYCASFYLIQNEHVVIINNTDIFNDVIYNPPSGYRRERIKLSGYVTINWNGGLDIPGFLFDQALTKPWQPWQDYNMGDVISYQSYYYSANAFTAGTAVFVSADWTQLSVKPTAQILPNWTNIATQFTDFYSLEVDSFDNAQQTMAQHLVGYQKRQYLNNIIQDDVSEFKFYQGMIREKGTQNVLNKLFNVLSSDKAESLTFYEEWALRVGRYGASNAFEDIEITLDETLFRNNPQGYALVPHIDSNINSLVIQQTPNNVYLKPLGYNSNPFPVLTNYQPLLRSAGYVNPRQVALTLANIDSIKTVDITTLEEGNYIWTTFENASWNIYRFTDLQIRLTNVDYDGTSILTIFAENILPLVVGEYIGLSGVAVLNGFYQIASISNNKFTVNATITNFPNPFTQVADVIMYALLSRRAASINNIDVLTLPVLNSGELLWTDNDGKWETWQYQPVYKLSPISYQEPTSSLGFGYNLAVNTQGTILVAGTEKGIVITYDKVGTGNAGRTGLGTVNQFSWIQRSVLEQPFISRPSSAHPDQIIQPNQVGQVLALSADGTWLVSASPSAGYACTNYVGAWSSSATYNTNDIVSYLVSTNKYAYYRALLAVPVNNVPTSTSLYWKTIPYIPVNQLTGSNSTLAGQGVISIYQKTVSDDYILVDTITSPLPIANENFGSTVLFSNNTLYVSARGYNTNAGRVYKLVYKTIPIVTGVIYNPVGSSKSTLALSSTAGIRAGMIVQGTGFTSGQLVVFVLTRVTLSSSLSATDSVFSVANVSTGMSVVGTGVLTGTVIVQIGRDASGNSYFTLGSSQEITALLTRITLDNNPSLTFGISTTTSLNTVSLNQSPDSTPSGALNFVVNSWTYDWSELYTGTTTTSNLGKALAVSQDASTLLISSSGTVDVYKNSGSGLVKISSLTGVDSHFGQSLAVSSTGTYLAISDDTVSSISLPQVGQVSVYSLSSTNTVTNVQNLVVHMPESNGLFGNKIAFMNDYKTIAVYSKNGDISLTLGFDQSSTTFDKKSTRFVTTQVNSGRVDMYDLYDTSWVYSESLDSVNIPTDGYGLGFAVGGNHVVVGAPYTIENGVNVGLIYDYGKLDNTYSWSINSQANAMADVSKIKKVFLYNKSNKTLVKYLDVIDPLQGKIAGPAEEELKYKTFYDPAIYSQGTASVTINSNTFWSDQQVGMLWWDLRTAKFVDNRVTDIGYRNVNWNTLVTGASIDVYEWVKTSLLPSSWDAVADTIPGLAQGISGTTLYGDTAYNTETFYDNVSKTFRHTYYYWVKNKKTVPSVPGRNMAAADVAKLIANPRGQGYSCLGITGTNSFSLVNIAPDLSGANIVLAIEYWLIDKIDQNVHSQWKLISDNTLVDLPKTIEQKWIDSLCGVDQGGRLVPDPTLPTKLKYGIENRPRQSMFVNRIEALKEIIERVNIVLLQNQISESRDLTLLDSYDSAPSSTTGLYDTSIDQFEQLVYANVGSFTRPTLTPVITNGRITGINIVSSGRGYLIPPYITIAGSGAGAVVKAQINSAGQIVGATILKAGDGYDSKTQCLVRDYSVLIKSDSTAQYAWSVYSYDPTNKGWSRTLSQSYDVRNYVTKVDWYATGFSQFSVADYSVSTFVDLNSINPIIGELVYVTTNSSGKWLLLEKIANVVSIDWTQSYRLVGIQEGTIQFKKSLYNFNGTNVGYDSNIFDNYEFDVQASTELRIILNVIKNKILIDDLKQNYLDLFFTSLHYVHSEQLYVDWAFKTSFVRATHNVGALSQPVNYPVDNLSNFQDYVAEVKPYRTKIREYVSNYTSLETTESAVTDFDLPAAYENTSITAITTQIINNQLVVSDPAIQQYPWKFWSDNVGFQVIDLVIVDGGSGYATIPTVIISNPTAPNGVTATAKALIANGKVNRIILTNASPYGGAGSGYLSAPTVTINGGLNVGGTPAKVIAVIGNGVVRNNHTKIKFDRVNQTYYITNLTQVDTLTGINGRQQFPLTWAPDVRIGKCNVTIDGVPVLRELYKLSIITSKTLGYTQYTGSITFTNAPADKSEIIVSYTKDISLFNATDRIQYYYNPTTGQLGKDLTQLMLGVDYGGVVVSGLGFENGSGWGEAPYYSDKWDNRNPAYTDYIVQVSANTNVFVFPTLPAPGTNLNVYYKKIKTDSHIITDTTVKTYSFDQLILNPTVTVTTTILTIPLTTTYVVSDTTVTPARISAGFNLIVGSTTGIRQGMIIFGQGFLTGQSVIKVVDGKSLRISAIPDNLTYRRTFNATGSSGTILVISNTEKLLVGMKISTKLGIEFVSNQTILKIVNNTTLIISAAPDVAPTTGETIIFSSVVANNAALTFSNNAGSTILTLNTVSGLTVGNVVTNTLVSATSMIPGTTYTIQNIGSTDFTLVGALSNLLGETFVATGSTLGTGTVATASAFSYNTQIIAIDAATNSVVLNQVISYNISASTQITFTQTLTELKDVIINSSSVVLNSSYTTGSYINISGMYAPVRLDDPYYGTAQQTNSNAIIPTPVIGTNIIPTVLDGGSASITITTIDDGGSATDSTPSSILEGQVYNQIGSNIVELPATFSIYSGDEFIIRESTSDGSIPPADNDYDTAITGGNFVYGSATGIAVDDIIIDGGNGLVTSTSSPAPEEVVPGQVVDTLAIKVYDQAPSGAAHINVASYITKANTIAYSIGQTPNSPRSVVVKLDSVIQTYNTDYTVDYRNGNVVFLPKIIAEHPVYPAAGKTLSIFSIGFSGAQILDLDHFVGDGITYEFITRAKWTGNVTSLVYVDGISVSALLFETDSTYQQSGLVGLKFSLVPSVGSLINYIIVNGNQQTFAITKVETIIPVAGQLTYTLQYPIGKALPNESNMIVRDGQTILQSPSNSYFTISKNRLNYTIDTTRAGQYSVPVSNIQVYAGNNLLTPNSDYAVDPSGITIKINSQVYTNYTNQQLVVSVISNAGYSYNATTGQITFAQAPTSSLVEIISSYVHDILDIQRTTYQYNSTYQLTSGTLGFYQFNEISGGIIALDRPVIDNNYVWVIKDNTLLTPSIDYKLNDDLQSIQVAGALSGADTITVITFGSNIISKSSISYMQFKDMLNRVTYKRLNLQKKTTLAEDLRWNDTQIVVVDASNFDAPNTKLNRPGVIEIRGERIEYFAIRGNILSQLRRGTLGTGVYPINRVGATVQFIGASETIPYTDTIKTDTSTSIGSNLVTLSFTPTSTSSFEVFVGSYGESVWEPNTQYITGAVVIVGVYTYRCTQTHIGSNAFFDVVSFFTINADGTTTITKTGVASSTVWSFFVANTRLQKNSYKMFNVNNAPYSPAGDVTFPADFSLVYDSLGRPTNQIQLRNAPAFGSTITVIQKTGILWDGYDLTLLNQTTPVRAGDTNSNILNDTSNIGNFIKAVPGVWYDGYNKYAKQQTTTGTFDNSSSSFDNGNLTFDQG